MTQPIEGSTSGTREGWLDCARGLGIILVVAAHTWRGLIDSHLMEWNPLLKGLDYSVYSFHMPLFFFLAGITAMGSMNKGRLRFARSKLRTVALPYFIWSYFIGSILLLAGSHANTNFTIADMLRIPWKPIQQFWFLQALFVIQMAAAILYSKRLIAIFSIILFLIAPIFFQHDTTLFNWLHFNVFFAAGIIIGNEINRLRAMSAWLWTATYGCAMAAGLASHQHYTAWIYLPAAAFGILLTARLSTIVAETRFSRFPSALGVSVLGQASMTIYVAHILVVAIVRGALLKLHVPFSPSGIPSFLR